MKKTYSKPIFAVERFELTQQIAGCSYLKINHNSAACVLNNTDANDFAVPGYYQSVYSLAYQGYFWSGCSKKPSQANDNDLICYHTSANMAFTS